MKTKNHLCPECHVCSYCLQRTARGGICHHPVVPIRGHCMHHDDIRPKDCATCAAKVTLSNTLLKVAEKNKTIEELRFEVAELEATVETNETLAEWDSDARTEQLHKEYGQLKLKYLAETGELRAEQNSLFGELATILDGPGKPREGETRNAYWLGRLGAYLIALDDARREQLDELLGNIVSQFNYGTIREHILRMLNHPLEMNLADYTCVDCGNARRCLKGAFVCRGCLSLNGKLDP